MTPKEKALELCKDFYHIPVRDSYYGMNWDMARKCALIAVEEIIKAIPLDCWIKSDTAAFWEQVKTEIEKL